VRIEDYADEEIHA
jgi:hypothetical protein